MRETMNKLTQGATRLFVLALGLGLVMTGWAVVPTPTAVWDGNFSTTKVNGWTLDANGNAVASDKSTITITSKGFTITPATAVTAGTGVSVLVKMSGVSQNADNDQILVCAKQNGVGVMVGTSLCAGAMTMHGAWNGAAKWSDSQNAETTFSVPSSGEYYIAFTTGDGSTTVREGVYVGGTMNLKEISGLRASSYTVQQITIGGRPASESEKASNAVISRVMIYTGCLTQQQMKDAIDDMETTKSYSLQCQASGNKGGLNWANFQLPYLTHYVESGSASLKTDKALRQITIPWRPDGTVNGSGATSLYLGITDSSGKLLALSSGADMSTVTTTSSSTFDFSQAYLSAGTQYRYWFLNSDSYSLGDTITEGIQMGCALYNIGSNVTEMRSDTMNAYCPAARFWCSNMTGSEFTATAGGTAVSTSGACADDITLKGVADGKFTLGGALNAARITLANAAATIEMDSGDSIKAQYLDNSTQKLVIDASNGATAVGTYTLFEGTLASAADADLEVTFPTLGSGYELYTTKTANKISYQVDRTAVNATLTLTANCNFSDVKDSIGWIDSNHSTLEIVNNQASPITLTFDENITAGSITVSGTGTTIIESSNSAVITAGTVTVPLGSTFDATGASITTCAGAGTFIWTAGYPATVPAGMTYQYVGSNNSESPAACAGVTVNGTLKTTGFISLTNFELASSGTYEVVSDTATVAAKAACKIAGNITIDAGATYVNANTSDGSASDAVNYDQSGMIFTIRGTLSMGNTRWSLRRKSYHEFRLYDGAVISGAGQSTNGALDWIENEAGQIDTYGGNVTISAAMRIRGGASVAFWVADGATTTISGTTNGTGTFTKSGANGTLNLTGTIGNGKLTVNEGCVNVGRSMAVNIGCGTSAGYVTASDGVVVTGSISSTSQDYVGTAMKGFLQTASKWNGSFIADWAGATGTQFDINIFGNANSIVEVTKLAGGYVSGSNASVTVEPTVNVSGTMTLDNGYSGKTTTFTKLTGSGTVTFNSYTCNITTLDNFTGTLTPTDSNGTTINTINLSSTPAFGAKVVTLGTGANIASVGNVSVNGVVDNTIALAVVADDGIYRAEAAYGGGNRKTLAEAVAAAETASADPSAVTVYNSSATIPSGYALVTAAGGAMTLRSAGNGGLIYWASSNSGDWSGEDSNGTHTFYTSEGGTSTTPYVTGDTVVFTSDIQIWSKTAAHGAKFQVGTESATAEVHFTRSGDNCDDYILDGSTIEIKSGSALVAERYGDTTPPTQAYTAWNSYSSHDGSEINDTTITGAGTFKVGGDTGGHGAASAVLSGTTAISCAIDLADGATLIVPSGCTVTAPTTSVTDKMVTYSTDSGTGTKTYSVVPTVAKLVNGQTETPYADIMTALGNLMTTLSGNPAAYVQVLDSTAELVNAYGGYGIGLDAVARRYAKAVAISGDAGFTTVQAAIDAVASEGSITLAADCSEALTLADGKTVTIVAKVGNVTYSYTPPSAVTPASYRVIAGETVDGTTTFTSKALYTVTIPAGVEHATATVNGSPVAGGASVQVVAGTNVEIVWTPASGYKITAGATQTINAIAENVTADAPTVAAMGATVSDVNFAYGADYATATVTATVAGDATAYTLTVGQNSYDGVVSGSTVTFSNVATGHASAYDSVSYTITAKDGETAVPVTSGGDGTAIVADVTAAGWINENATTTGTSAGGSWTNAVSYTNGKAEISDNRFEATTASTASRVVLAFEVCFSSVSDADVDGTAQAAIKIGESGGATTFMVLASNAAWTPVSRGDFVPDASATYKVVMTIDYGNGSYGVTVGDNVLTNASGSASFPLAKSGAASVKNIDFVGSGTLTSMKGDQLEGYMVKDALNHFYATIEAATQAYNSANGPYIVLHDGTAPSGWKIDNVTKKLIKIAKGLFFMAY